MPRLLWGSSRSRLSTPHELRSDVRKLANAPGSLHDRPQADTIQGKSVLSFIDVGKKDGKLEMGGERVGDKVRPRLSRRRAFVS